MTISTYRDLTVWQRSMDLAYAAYDCANAFPAAERYGLSSQLRRAAVSIPSNIAEGQARAHTKEFLHFLSIARGSLQEFETLLLIAQHCGYVTEQQLAQLLELCDHVGRMLTALRKKLSKTVSRES